MSLVSFFRVPSHRFHLCVFVCIDVCFLCPSPLWRCLCSHLCFTSVASCMRKSTTKGRDGLVRCYMCCTCSTGETRDDRRAANIQIFKRKAEEPLEDWRELKSKLFSPFDVLCLLERGRSDRVLKQHIFLVDSPFFLLCLPFLSNPRPLSQCLCFVESLRWRLSFLLHRPLVLNGGFLVVR